MKVFITGTSSGIGRELAKLLVKQGHHVWGVARRLGLLEQLNGELQSENFHFSQCDVADPVQVVKTIGQLKTSDFLPDAVVLNSAVFTRDLKGGLDFSLAQQGLAVNYGGAMIWIEKFLPEFLKRGSGKFLAVSSTSAFRPDVTSVSLPASKAALSLAFRSLRLRYRGQNIKFTTVYFGPVATSIIPEYSSDTGRKKYFFVMSAEEAAKNLYQALTGSRDKYFFPFWLTLLFRLSLIFPDSVFSRISRYLKR